MTELPGDGGKETSAVIPGKSKLPYCRRLRLVAILLGAVGALGIATALLLALSPAGDGLGDLLPDSKADVMGQVRDTQGFVVEGAKVTYVDKGTSSITGVTGWYFIDELDTGTVELRMEADGFKTVLKTVQLERGQYVVDFTAMPGSGQVDVEGEAVPEAGDPGAGRPLMIAGIIVASAFAFVGAYAAHLQRWYPLVMIGCFLGVLTWGWFIGSALAVVALVIALPLRREFGKRSKECEVPWHEPPPPSMEAPPDGVKADDDVIDVAPVLAGRVERGGQGGMPPDRQ